jgi:hypothetical protein
MSYGHTTHQGLKKWTRTYDTRFWHVGENTMQNVKLACKILISRIQNSQMLTAKLLNSMKVERNFGWGHTTNLGQGSSKMVDVICICKTIN